MVESDKRLDKPIIIPWIRQEDYPAYLSVSKDTDNLLATWEGFVKVSKDTENLWTNQKRNVERIDIDPDAFIRWCGAGRKSVRYEAMVEFAILLASEKARMKRG